MKSLSMVKRLAVATAAAAALAGPVTAAHALQFSAGDAVLAVYGNNSEHVSNLGSYSNLISTGLNLNLSSIMSQVSTGGNPVKYAIFGYTGSEIFFGDKFAIAEWTSLQKTLLQPNTLVGNLSTWSGALGNAADARNFFPKDDTLSFTTNLNAAGSDSLGGTTPAGRPGAAGIDETLYLLQRTGAANTLAQVSTALLSSNGQLQIGQVAPVPVPAAVVLFASGLVGLVGLARRRMSGTRQDAASSASV